MRSVKKKLVFTIVINGKRINVVYESHPSKIEAARALKNETIAIIIKPITCEVEVEYTAKAIR